MEPSSLLTVQDLVVTFTIEGHVLRAVDGVSFTVPKGKTLGLVGESGCGKSVTALSSMGLIPSPPGRIEGGSIRLGEQELTSLDEESMQSMRGNRMSMIFQEPMTALNPVFTIGNQLSEVFTQHQGASDEEALTKSIEALGRVGIPAPERRVHEYPHQLSGGMRQRVMIAMALACNPELLIADEPTTALDVTIQAQILDLMRKLQEESGTSILFITHDLGVVAEMCDEVLVMYGGRAVERAPVVELFERPMHPYTQGLMNSRVTLDQQQGDKLEAIEGVVPSLFEMPKGCPFQTRCSRVVDRCRSEMPPLETRAQGHEVACWEVG